MDTNEVTTSQNEGGKIQRQYDEILTKVITILGDKSKLRPTKRVPGSVLEEIVKELTDEDVEQARVKTKEELKTLLKKHMEFEESVSAKEKELAQVKEKGQKDFIEAARKFFNKIEKADDVVNRMKKSLEKAAEGVSSANTDESPIGGA